jgi:polyisoprenoid-binding protein YceI
MMKTKPSLYVAALAASLALPALAADTYNLDKAHSEVGFQVVHLGLSKVRGHFKDFDAKISIDPARPEASSVEFTAQVASVDTANETRDNDLRGGPGLFEAAKFPTLTFKSSKLTAKGKDLYDVAGTLTLHGVSKEVVLPVKVTGPIQDPWGNTKVAFEIATTLNRKDYGISWHKTLDNGGLVVADNVDVFISLEAAKQKDAAAAK